jgi:hypothetical protein
MTRRLAVAAALVAVVDCLDTDYLERVFVEESHVPLVEWVCLDEEEEVAHTMIAVRSLIFERTHRIEE